MTKGGTVYFRKRDCRIEAVLNDPDLGLAEQFVDSIANVKPSRLDNFLEIEVLHKVDLQIPRIVQLIIDTGVKSFSLRTVYPVPSNIASTPRPYMLFEYEEGSVIDQWTDISFGEDGDELMIDVIEIAFQKKTVTDCVWRDDNQPAFRVYNGDRQAASAFNPSRYEGP